MLTQINRANEANEVLKTALTSHNSNLNLRAYYTYHLIHYHTIRAAKDFVYHSLKHSEQDLYTLCASGWLHYNQARENRDTSPKAVEDRKTNFRRAAEFYEKALRLDSMCAVAAQGLAIITAEDALGTMGGALSRAPAPDEGQKRFQHAREALEIFAKVRESINDGSVYLNIGHCYYSRDEFDRAIESVSLFIDLAFIAMSSVLISFHLPSTRRRQSSTTATAFLYCCAYVGPGMRKP